MTDEVQTPEALFRLEEEARGWMKFVIPSIARYNPDQHSTATGLTTLMWLDNVERYMELHRAGVSMLAIPCSNWKQDPLRTAITMLDDCSCRLEHPSAMERTLSKDSQEGSSILQDVLKKKTSFDLLDKEEMNHFLQPHPYIHTKDFEVANSLKL